MIMDLVMMRTKQFVCKCGAKNCVGYIVREGSRWRIKKPKSASIRK